ncbi:hypothetical protein E2562_016544 [Oryza meyeriana var. granulata]|uniref:Uncharacterized protein n=1 Tax=Oryza meyeriana var. granulata TaxID=110450 RepID=A0A6G1C707_9ORYZ|nr:hypothetical protein E2562_016544 [Oryza meyeriana var. granulata]
MEKKDRWRLPWRSGAKGAASDQGAKEGAGELTSVATRYDRCAKGGAARTEVGGIHGGRGGVMS